jgi:hypothetical protein
MAPGQDCLECHSGGEARRWTAAGTWARGAQVSVTDANGKTVPMRGNKVGNFYTAEALTPPLTVSVDGATMDTGVTVLKGGRGLLYGGCNACHVGGERKPDLTQGLMAPGQDCLACHSKGGMAEVATYTVAGTWGGPGHVVTIEDATSVVRTKTTNAAGNFYWTEPIAFPLKRVEVDGESMDPEKMKGWGGCNRCHGHGEDPDDD